MPPQQTPAGPTSTAKPAAVHARTHPARACMHAHAPPHLYRSYSVRSSVLWATSRLAKALQEATGAAS